MQKHWRTNNYYSEAEKGSAKKNYQGFKVLNQIAKNSKNILDVGCGEGTRLANLESSGKKTGIDISDKAIATAKKNHSKIDFFRTDFLKYRSKYKYDLVYSAFVIEHVKAPDDFLIKMAGLVGKGGYLIIMAPNYGAPNRSSPVFSGSRIMKLCMGLYSDLFNRGSGSLNWNNVEPSIGKYFQDSDTTTEPYARTLSEFINKLGFSTLVLETLWEEELKGAKIWQKLFKILSHNRVYPFYYWGPHILYVARRIN